MPDPAARLDTHPPFMFGGLVPDTANGAAYVRMPWGLQVYTVAELEAIALCALDVAAQINAAVRGEEQQRVHDAQLMARYGF